MQTSEHREGEHLKRNSFEKELAMNLNPFEQVKRSINVCYESLTENDDTESSMTISSRDAFEDDNKDGNS